MIEIKQTEADIMSDGEKQIQQLKTPEEIRQHILDIYSHNPFMHDYFHVDIDAIECGRVVVSLQTVPEKHNNHRGILHGGVMLALADSVSGVLGASVGAVVVTVSMTMNFIRTARPGSRIRVEGHITHNGHTTMVIESNMYDENNKLMANMLHTMMVVGHFPEIPRTW